MINEFLSFNTAYISEGFTIAGSKEKKGRLGELYDVTVEDDKCGEDTFEKGERNMFATAVKGLISKANIKSSDIGALVGGDLLNQIISATFAARELGLPFIGLYNACATYVESLIISSMLVDSKYQDRIICFTGSHFSTAERQYRYPLELGVLRSPVSQWTATGVGSTLISSIDNQVAQITKGWVGKVVDYGVDDVNNMGAAMAPAAYETLLRIFKSTNTAPSDYDLILTGDLGKLGSSILRDMAKQEGYYLGDNYIDCGSLLFYDEQQVLQGGSGAACSPLVFNSYVLKGLKEKKFSKLLLIGTGALMSPISSFQGDTIPTIAHAVEVVAVQEAKK